MDFDDLLVYTAQLLNDFPAVREKYAQRFVHVLVDEFQDTNLAQYSLVKHLASAHKNIFCVGDPDQCFPRGAKIQTPLGEKKIENLKAGDEVLAASGRGSTTTARVAHVGKSIFKGNLVTATTRNGHIITAHEYRTDAYPQLLKVFQEKIDNPLRHEISLVDYCHAGLRVAAARG